MAKHGDPQKNITVLSSAQLGKLFLFECHTINDLGTVHEGVIYEQIQLS